jgi:hypothetical protein
MRRCSICALPALPVVDRALVAGGEPMAVLAKLHGVSRQALLRHRDGGHIPKALTEAHRDGVPDRLSQLLTKLENLEYLVSEYGAAARATGDVRGATAAVRESTRLAELVAKITGDLKPAPTVQIAVTATPEFQHVAGRVLEALIPFPDARRAVLAALKMIE